MPAGRSGQMAGRRVPGRLQRARSRRRRRRRGAASQQGHALSLVLASAVGAVYVTSVIGAHRLNVWRQRSAAFGYATLKWLDWGALLDGLIPQGESPGRAPAPAEAGPPPTLLAATPKRDARARHDLLCALGTGHRIDQPRAEGSRCTRGAAL